MTRAGSTVELLLAEEGRELLRIARASLRAHLGLGGGPSRSGPPAVSGRLAEPRGAFVTFTVGGRLRGCTGYIEGVRPLAEAVNELAVSSAARDHRFEPVRPDEVERIHIEVSVLTPPRPIAPQDVEIGRHGLIARFRGRSGLLLPQVAPEWGWEAPEFVERTCEKAGLSRDAWRQDGFQLLAFEAQIFEE